MENSIGIKDQMRKIGMKKGVRQYMMIGVGVMIVLIIIGVVTNLT